eukprot:scaffold3283_cov237-Pinguiococcus_pyrenoidosus.AAC.3
MVSKWPSTSGCSYLVGFLGFTLASLRLCGEEIADLSSWSGGKLRKPARLLVSLALPCGFSSVAESPGTLHGVGGGLWPPAHGFSARQSAFFLRELPYPHKLTGVWSAGSRVT